MNDTKTLHISSSPHFRGRHTTRELMLDVLIALLPVFAAGVFAYGYRALIIIVLSVGSSVLFEFLYTKIMKMPTSIGDCSAAVTGAILAVNLPSTVPFWMPVLGSLFAIIIVKMLFGGLGHNFMNPALAARVFLLISFAGKMTSYPTTVRLISTFREAVSEATPLAAVKAGEEIHWLSMFTEMHTGCIGEASVIAILLGALYLLIRGTITPRIPFTYIISTVVFIVIISVMTGNAEVLTLNYIMAQVMGGGLLLGAFFMASDYVTNPSTATGQVIFAAVLGLLTAMIRILSSGTEGVSYAIIIGNMLSPLIDKLLVPAYFGKRSRAIGAPSPKEERAAKREAAKAAKAEKAAKAATPAEPEQAKEAGK